MVRDRTIGWALLGSSALALLVSMPAAAQQAAAPQVSTEEASEPGGDIIVTGTRVVRDGYMAPTPTTVIGEAELNAKAPVNIADYVNQLPSLSGSVSPRAYTGAVSGGTIGINALNLRAIGSNRTLILLDGRRVAASTIAGLVDVNTIPQAMVKRVDIVTGGASANWGSDALSGVVNFVLDKDFTGIKGTVQGGVTDYGDDKNINLSLTAGTAFAGGRGHIQFSAEYAQNEGIDGIGDRKWYNGAKIISNPAYTATNGQPALIAAANVGFATATPGGIITSGPLRGTYFGEGGTPMQFNYGSVVSGNLMIGGDWRYADFGLSGDISPASTRQSYFGRVDYDLTDNVEIYAEASYNRATTSLLAFYQWGFGNVTIRPDNAFIPEALRSQVTGNFSMGSFYNDLGRTRATTRRSATRGVIGLRGDFDALGSNWTWDAYGQKTITRTYTDGRTSIMPRLAAATDSVYNDAGAIVCRSTLTDPTNGCVPFNIFGTGVNTQAARDYILGTTWARNRLTQEVFAATAQGEPFSTWAGPVSLALGVEHRREGVTGSNDPLSPARSYFVGNYLATTGKYNVTEGFVEAVVPLASEAPFAEKLDFNGAVRATNYSTSGFVTTWKAGLTWSPVSDITFRVTRSRDIRAPNLSELFQAGGAGTSAVADPFNGGALYTIVSISQGNPDLKPEKADTLGLGVVLQPSFIPGLAGSVDYYDIKIKDQIASIGSSAILEQCYQGLTAYCAGISRNAEGILTGIVNAPVNIASFHARGLDFEASYRRPMLGGNVSLRFLATRFLKSRTDNGITPATDLVGTNGTLVSARTSLPKWRYTGTATYAMDKFSLSLTARGFSAGYINSAFIECTSGCPTSTTANQTINDNSMPAAMYFDANITVKLMDGIETFLSVDNIANKDPYQMPYGPSIGANPISINPVLYDTMGRLFRAGVRFKL
ncbi:hypothetical protein L288_17145 [Sphingobium quisquiliarum P25]|uniref:TonB-denpendent receptor n=2 Tax=Sphingobium quisquiliarum TaxID=538379 RepID=T0GMN5_9SPHN|nr:hypothetical protein L288_17145 [Sphingobium quisquiliarum P25]